MIIVDNGYCVREECHPCSDTIIGLFSVNDQYTGVRERSPRQDGTICRGEVSDLFYSFYIETKSSCQWS